MSFMAMYNLDELWDKLSEVFTDLVMEKKITKSEGFYISYVLGIPARQGAKSVTMISDETGMVDLVYSDEDGVPLEEMIQFMKVINK